MQSLTETLLKKFPEAVLSVDVDTARSEVTVHVAASRILEIARFLHDDPEASFDHITDICSADYPADQQRFEVIYLLLSLPHGKRIRLKARITEDNPSLDSVTSVWRGATFLEREVYDMMGIRFRNHPTRGVSDRRHFSSVHHSLQSFQSVRPQKLLPEELHCAFGKRRWG